MELRARPPREEGWRRGRWGRPVELQLERPGQPAAAAAAAGWARTTAGGAAARQRRAGRARRAVEKAEADPRRAAAGGQGLVIGVLGVLAQLAITATGPSVTSACRPFELAVTVRAPGA